MRLALATAVLLATAASRGGCARPTTTSFDPCSGKTCGDACRVCPPDDASCVETAVAKACDPAGSCSPVGTFACGLAAACSGKACGDACTYDPPCRQSSPPCMIPSYAGHCDANGACMPGEVTCGPVADCTGRPCGTACAAPCPYGAPCPAPGACDGKGACVASITLVCPPAWGCEGKACGDPCGYCPPGADPATCPVPTFAATACNVAGECVTVGTFTCGYDPCAGKACHDRCDPCPPGTACPATVFASWCDGAGACVPQGQGAACP